MGCGTVMGGILAAVLGVGTGLCTVSLNWTDKITDIIPGSHFSDQISKLFEGDYTPATIIGSLTIIVFGVLCVTLFVGGCCSTSTILTMGYMLSVVTVLYCLAVFGYFIWFNVKGPGHIDNLDLRSSTFKNLSVVVVVLYAVDAIVFAIIACLVGKEKQNF